ncbi:hypothetical protein L1049_011032 [Liquidambar formosana]|uniref:Uncharacterized protein n=1 Tax=Liquidambar formosana TaxID=63359 RepID=A0AAP0RR33_LIQFO
MASPSVQCEIAIDPSICLDKTDGIECFTGSALTFCSISSSESVGEAMRSLNEDHFEERAKGVEEDQIYGGEEDYSQDSDVEYALDLAKPDVDRTDICQITEDTSDTEVSEWNKKISCFRWK